MTDPNVLGFVGRPYDLYFVAKYTFAGFLIASILYGAHKLPPPTRLSSHAHCVYSVPSRDAHRAVFPMYGSAT